MDNSFDSLLNASAVPQDEKVQAFIAESRNNRNRCYELSEQVTAQVATDGKMLQKYLDVQSTFDRYTTFFRFKKCSFFIRHLFWFCCNNIYRKKVVFM